MRILLSAFACAPSGGSEGGVGWHWATALAGAGHRVTVLTDVTRRAAIEAALADAPVANLEFVFHRPRALAGVRLSARSAQLLYSAWQYALLPEARRLHASRRFELAIHLTYGVYRHPSFLGFLGVPFVFGPVGGGEDAPWALKAGLPPRERVKELARTLLNRLATFNPCLRLALSRTDLVLAKTAQTAAALPGAVRGRTRVHVEIGVVPHPGPELPPVPERAAHERFEILYAGRLLGFKGIDLVIDAFAAFVADRPGARLTLLGSGPLAGMADGRIAAHGLGDRVRRIAHVPQEALFERYRASHCLLFPSLHDSSGNVVLEALHHGLPVVCLDLGGPATIIDRSCGIAVATGRASRATVVARLAAALARLHDDEALRCGMGAAGMRRANAWTWRSRALGALELVAGPSRDGPRG